VLILFIFELSHGIDTNVVDNQIKIQKVIHSTPIELERNRKREDINLSKMFNKYESTFIILNPFFRLKEETSSINLKNFDDYPKKMEILKFVAPYCWNEFKEDIALNSLKDIANLIYNHWDSSNKKSKLDLLLKNKNIYPPNEGFISELLENPILKSILTLGYKKVSYETEVGKKRNINIQNFISNNKTFGDAPLIKTLDEKICIYQAFDLVSTFISSSNENIKSIVKNANLEGFFADETTTLLWWQLK
jgi:hypothetical protein